MIENPILRGFSPDPSVIRIGEDYYIATSSFEWWPGVKLFHSRNLKSWEQIPSPLRRESQLNMIGDPASGGVWAPCLSYDGERVFLVYTDVKTKKGRYYNTHNYMVWTDDIYGEWSDPVYLNSIGFDPSLFHDRDGRKYLVNMVNGFKGVLLQEIVERDGTWRLTGERRKIYSGSGIGCTEGPHLYHIGDWYYLLVAEGGTGYGHCVTLARSGDLWGPYETAPGNPILTADQADASALQKCGHADLVETPSGEWYMAFLCSRPLAGKRWCTLGRETAIQKLRWTKDGWPEPVCGGRFAQKWTPEPGAAAGRAGSMRNLYPLEDTFQEKKLSVLYNSPRVSYESFADLTARPGYLRLRGQESLNSLHRVSLLAVRQQEFHAVSETELEFEPDHPEQAAGLSYMYDAMNFYLLVKTMDESGKCVLTLLKSDGGVITDEMEPIPVPREGLLKLRAETSREGDTVTFSYCAGEDGFHQAGVPLSTEIVTDEHCRGFTGAHFGMYIHDMTGLGICADYKRFSVRYPESGK